jgi:hypothetical protein
MGTLSGLATRVARKTKVAVGRFRHPGVALGKVWEDVKRAGSTVKAARQEHGTVLKKLTDEHSAKIRNMESSGATKSAIKSAEAEGRTNIAVAKAQKPSGYGTAFFRDTKSGKRINRTAKVGAAVALAPAAVVTAKALAGGPPPPQYYEGGDIWPNQDEECGRIEVKAFRDPKTFVG